MNKHEIRSYSHRLYYSKSKCWCWLCLTILLVMNRFSSSGLQFSVVLNGFPGENLNREKVSRNFELNLNVLIYVIDVVYFNCIYPVVPRCFMGMEVFHIHMLGKLAWAFSKWHFPSYGVIWQNWLVHENLTTANVSCVCGRGNISRRWYSV